MAAHARARAQQHTTGTHAHTHTETCTRASAAGVHPKTSVTRASAPYRSSRLMHAAWAALPPSEARWRAERPLLLRACTSAERRSSSATQSALWSSCSQTAGLLACVLPGAALCCRGVVVAAALFAVPHAMGAVAIGPHSLMRNHEWRKDRMKRSARRGRRQQRRGMRRDGRRRSQ